MWRCGGLLQKTAAALFTEAVAVAPDGDDVTVVKQRIKYGRRHHGVSEDGAPFSDSPIGGHQHGAALVTTDDELEEQMRGVRFERKVAEFVDD